MYKLLIWSLLILQLSTIWTYLSYIIVYVLQECVILLRLSTIWTYLSYIIVYVLQECVILLQLSTIWTYLSYLIVYMLQECVILLKLTCKGYFRVQSSFNTIEIFYFNCKVNILEGMSVVHPDIMIPVYDFR
jgi:hypothetical protein